MRRPVAIDLFCGLGGWAEGFLAEGYEVIGFDIERHDYGTGGYPGQLVLQDVLTLHGSQFRNAACIVASPPCQEYSYMGMPWSRAKQIARALEGRGEFPEGYTGSRTVADLNALFDACFRIQREASEAAGRHIPLVVENVKGAQRWVGRAAWHYGSYYLWGDVPALMPPAQSCAKIPGQGWSRWRQTGEVSPHWRLQVVNGLKNRETSGGTWFGVAHGKRTPRQPGCPHRGVSEPGTKQHGSDPAWFDKALDERRRQAALVIKRHRISDGVKSGYVDGYKRNHPAAFGWKIPRKSGGSLERKAASAMIAKIPFELAWWIAYCYHPERTKEAV